MTQNNLSPAAVCSDPPAGTGAFQIGRPRLQHGGNLPTVNIRYTVTGDRGPWIVALGGISADSRVCDDPDSAHLGWWRELFGPGAAIDTTACRVLSFDYVGGIGGSSSPALRNADDADFPIIDTRDQAAFLARLLDHLGISRIDALIGASYGGMVALAFAEGHAARVRRCIAISAADRALPAATAVRAIQRDIVRLGLAQNCEVETLTLARALAMTTYRSATELNERFDAPPRASAGGYAFPVHAYLRSRGWAFAHRASSRSYLTLSQSIDLHRVDPTAIRGEVTLIASATDTLVPPQQIRRLAEALGGPTRYHEIPSAYGHDAFLKEPEALGAILRYEIATTQEVAA